MKAVPSTFCMTWWIWPFRTETEPKRLSREMPGAVVGTQPQSDESGICANPAMGAVGRSATSFFQPLDSSASLRPSDSAR